MITITRWERLETYLFDHDKEGTEFTVHEYADHAGFDTAEASADIQSYQRAQRRHANGKTRNGTAETLYVIRRVPGTRTTAARWAVGANTRAVRAISTGFYEDVKRRVERAFMPDLLRIRQKNPRAARRVEVHLSGIVEGAMKVLEAASKGIYPDDE